MRKHLLLWLSLSLFLPAVAAVGAAWVGVVKVQDALDDVTRTYARNLAESIADKVNLSSSLGDPFYQRQGYKWWLRFFARDLPMPGQVAVVDNKGNFVMGTPGASECLEQIWRSDVPVGETLEAYDCNGKRYTMVVYPVENGELYVVAAISWDQLLGPVLQVSTLWPFVVGFFGLCSFFAAVAFLRWVILPLRQLCDEISAIRWGEGAPDPLPFNSSVQELRTLRKAVFELALSAIERVSLTKRYVSDLIRVQEEEKSHLSREIHDSTLQAIAALIQRVRLARMETDNRDALVEHLNAAETIAHSSIKELRELCDELDPPWLDLGFEHAITELLDRMQRTHGITIHLEFLSHPDFGRDQTLALFRVVQEAVNNAVRHGGAKVVDVCLSHRNGQLVLSIADNGKGFEMPENLKKLQLGGHRGLANMYERMNLIGGNLEIKPSPGNGTEVVCWLQDVDVAES